MDRHTLYDPKQPLEIQRTIHSFDPCIACAVHVADPNGEELVRSNPLKGSAMTDTIDVRRPRTSSSPRPRSISSSYVEACVHCGQCADACHFYQASGIRDIPRPTNCFRSPRPIAGRDVRCPGLLRRASTKTISRNGKAPVRHLHDVRALHDGLSDGDRHRLDRGRRAPGLRRRRPRTQGPA